MIPSVLTSSKNPLQTIYLAAGLLLAASSPMMASVTIEVFFDDGNLSDGMVAALVADVNQDGFVSLDDPTIPGTILTAGQNIGTSDDVMVAVLEADAGLHWNDGAGIAEAAERIDYSVLGISPGTPLILYIFPDASQPGDTLSQGERILRYRNTETGGSGGDIAFEAPADPGVYTLSALVSASGGNFDPQNLSGSEIYDEGMVGGEDHGDTRATATWLTSAGVPTGGFIDPGDADFFTFSVGGPSRITIYTTGDTNTVGALFSSNGSPVNDPGLDDDEGSNSNFQIEEILLSGGSYNIAVTGEGGNQTGAYELVYEIVPFVDKRPDATIGKKLSQQNGNDYYDQSGANQVLSLVTKKKHSMIYYFTVQNDGELPDAIVISAKGKSKNFDARYYQLTGGASNVTALVSRAGHLANIDSRGEIHFKLTVKPTRRAVKSKRSAKQSYLISVRSGSLTDGVRAVARRK